MLFWNPIICFVPVCVQWDVSSIYNRISPLPIPLAGLTWAKTTTCAENVREKGPHTVLLHACQRTPVSYLSWPAPSHPNIEQRVTASLSFSGTELTKTIAAADQWTWVITLRSAQTLAVTRAKFCAGKKWWFKRVLLCCNIVACS